VAMLLTGHKARTIFERYNIVSEDFAAMKSEALRGSVLSLPRAGKPRLGFPRFNNLQPANLQS